MTNSRQISRSTQEMLTDMHIANVSIKKTYDG